MTIVFTVSEDIFLFYISFYLKFYRRFYAVHFWL